MSAARITFPNTVWTQIRPNLMLGLILIQNVWHSYDVPERVFWKRWFWKKNQQSIQRILTNWHSDIIGSCSRKFPKLNCYSCSVLTPVLKLWCMFFGSWNRILVDLYHTALNDYHLEVLSLISREVWKYIKWLSQRTYSLVFSTGWPFTRVLSI